MNTSRYTLIIVVACALSVVARADEQLALEAYKRHHFDLAYREFKAAAVTSRQAQFYLGRMFERGEGMQSPNSRLAIRWYLKAASDGYLEAEAALGKLFANGNGDQLPKNYSEAKKWLTRAAEKGHGASAARLGDFYLSGRGGSKDLARGVAWVQLASSLGFEPASNQLSHLRSTLSPSVFDDASKLQPELAKKGQGRHE